ncbi:MULTISPECIES: Bug family tripartite tricarboxylate transporter substrate binding protein [Devosia]|uniref:Tripartite tricarboxylate transporter substrate binding protein n=2 Tax=Devosia TaxID=46913 RepID=A0A6M1S9E9_9HYPH|nr:MULTISPECIES: tripartite tricarboxylate transporter substrate-binding protein [Devosia]NGP16427.1 tripartite tricarboxylate transporter substrate binding protein [Devosia aurantiaca]QQR39304.1 tripartite tricarboxylate transporter substrate binding protein [Devosia rhizoryzae]
MKIKTALASLALFGALATGAAQAQVNVMLPANPGGGWDGLGRQAFQAMNDAGIYTEGVNFTNTGGAGGTVGLAEFLGTSSGQPDALAVFGAITVGAIELNNSPINLAEFKPVARMTAEYLVVAVAADSPYNTLADLVEAIKADPGAHPLGGGSAGGVDHIALALLAQEGGISVADLNYIPQTSGAETVTAIVNGTLTAGVSGTSEFGQFAEQGRIKILAVTSAERRENLPDVPTFTEAGYPVELANWRGILAAPGAPEENTALWVDRFTQLSQSDAWKQVLATQGWEDFFLAGDEFGAFIAEETETQGQILKDAGLVQ